MARQKRHTAADVHAAKMAELLNKWNWTLDQYVNSREVWGGNARTVTAKIPGTATEENGEAGAEVCVECG